jgi:hypothetical protein
MSPSVAVTSLIAFAALALTGCAESRIVEPGAGETAARAMSGTSSRGAAPSRPAGGTCTLASRPEVLPPLAGQPANVVRRRTAWVCQLQHLGHTTAAATETGTALAGGSSVAGTAVFTAANGDQLVTTFSGMATFPDQNGIVTFDGTDTVTGGTGRFAGASGSFTRATRVNVFLGTGQLVLDGTLSY